MPSAAAVVAFDFDPFVTVAGRDLRLETLAIAGAMLVSLLVAARIAGVTPAGGEDAGKRLRRDDLLFIVLGIVPGALVGGRIGYALLHLGYYQANSGDVIDPGQGSLELALGVVGGLVTGSYVARLLEAPVGRWLHALTLPAFLAIGLGKVAMALGGSGQGAPATESWATAYVGQGPWGSLAPAIPAYPSQLLEGAATALVLVLVVLLMASRRLPSHDGRVFFVALCLWAVARAIVAATWRDEAVAGGLRAAQWIALAVAAGSLVALAVAVRLRPRREGTSAEPTDLRWPDPQQPTTL